MKIPVILVFLGTASAVSLPALNSDVQGDALLGKRADCNVCVTTINEGSTTVWDRSIPYDQGGLTSRGIYTGCDAMIDRKRSTRCSDWSVSTRGACGTVTKQQTC
ncbi:hypothetical protein PTMSG1_03747 [Pyrenophora teres f. maculata]|nr:hypothetical protein PTMSG1_03747 [Pyrenophora teres f. maculata]